MNRLPVAIIGAGPYGLSVSAHLAARQIEHRIFGQPMQFWSNVAEAGEKRYLKSYCFVTDLSTPARGYSFADYNGPRGLETFEPCSMRNFTEYGRWFQKNVVPWNEPVDVSNVQRQADGFMLTLTNGERVAAAQVVVATGLSYFASLPPVLSALPPELAIHTSKISSFASFKGKSVAVIGAGQSALEAAALFREEGADPQLLVREEEVFWQQQVSRERSAWRRLRSPISGLGTGPKSWLLTNFPHAVHRFPEALRTHIVKNEFAAAGAWWLRDRVENKLPMHLGVSVVAASEVSGRVALKVRSKKDGSEREVMVDHVIGGNGYKVDVDRIHFLDHKLRTKIERVECAPKLNSTFESSVAGLHFVGPTSAMSFGPLFRFVVGAGYTARTLSAHLSSNAVRSASSEVRSAA